jgi:hypothetical protein
MQSKAEGKKLSKVPMAEINLKAQELLEANAAEFFAKARASAFVQEGIRRLHEKSSHPDYFRK